MPITDRHDDEAGGLVAVRFFDGGGGLRGVAAGLREGRRVGRAQRLGSGRVRDVPARTLRAADGSEHRYAATVVPRGEAIRSVTAAGTGAGYDLEEPPGGLPCITSVGGFGVGLGFVPGDDGPARPHGPDEQVAAEAGGHRRLVRDADQERLCSGVDRLLADAAVPERERVLGAERRQQAVAAAGVGGRRDRDAARLRGRSGHAERRARAARGGRGWRLSAARFDDVACVMLALAGGADACGAAITGTDGAFATPG